MQRPATLQPEGKIGRNDQQHTQRPHALSQRHMAGHHRDRHLKGHLDPSAEQGMIPVGQHALTVFRVLRRFGEFATQVEYFVDIAAEFAPSSPSANVSMARFLRDRAEPR